VDDTDDPIGMQAKAVHVRVLAECRAQLDGSSTLRNRVDADLRQEVHVIPHPDGLEDVLVVTGDQGCSAVIDPHPREGLFRAERDLFASR
jgi:hypothetical protein